MVKALKLAWISRLLSSNPGKIGKQVHADYIGKNFDRGVWKVDDTVSDFLFTFSTEITTSSTKETLRHLYIKHTGYKNC